MAGFNLVRERYHDVANAELTNTANALRRLLRTDIVKPRLLSSEIKHFTAQYVLPF